jgi:hypothetical protein
MAGGMEIFVDGAGLDEMANLNTVLFDSEENTDLRLAGLPLDSKSFTTRRRRLFRVSENLTILFI